MKIIIGIISGLVSISLITSMYLYLIYVIPFILNLNKKKLLKDNNNLIKYVLTGGIVSVFISFLIFLSILFYGDPVVIKWFYISAFWLFLIFILDTHIISKLLKTGNKKKRETILNFKDMIIRSANSPEVGTTLRGMEIEPFKKLYERN